MDRRMSDVEALMWNLEKDPRLSSAFANVTILDSPPDVDQLRRRLTRALAVVPRLRQRVVSGLGRMAPPEWRDDPDIDLDYHVRRLALPHPGTERQLFDLVPRLAAEPFDRTRPLWRFTVLDGLEGGRAAVLQQMHHTITDGEGGVRMSVEFLDTARDQPEPEPLPLPEAEIGPTNIFTTGLDTAGHAARRQLGVGRRVVGEVLTHARHPSRIAKSGGDAIETARSLARQAAVADPARSPLWTDRSLKRAFEVTRVELDDAKRASKALGGSVNDLFVAAVAGGAGAYHRAHGVDVDELRMAMPVSTRTKGSTDANAFTPTRALVPVGEDPEVRFTEIRDRLSAVRRERAIVVAGALAGVVNLLPTSMLVRIARQQVETVDFTTSNVRGAPFDLFIAGARIEANYPLGPLGGTAFNCTLLSSGGWLDMGLHIDAAAIDDPAGLRDAVAESWATLLALGA